MIKPRFENEFVGGNLKRDEKDEEYLRKEMMKDMTRILVYYVRIEENLGILKKKYKIECD